MFQLFLQARAQNLVRSRRGGPNFRARSEERDTETDHDRVGSILVAVEAAINGAESELEGLTRRVEDVLARAAVTLGNGTDEYLEREALDNHHHDLFDREILNGQRRLMELATQISHFKFLKAALLSRFTHQRA